MKRGLLITGIVVSAVAVFVSSAGYLAWQYFGNRVAGQMTVLPNVTVATSNPLPGSFLAALRDNGPHEPLNVLILGSDTREGQGAGFGDVAGARSDTAMLVHINAARTDATVISWPRDLYVTLPSCVSSTGKTYGEWSTKFNAAFSEGGPNCTITTITALSGIPVHHVVVVDFNGFKSIVDALGGLPVCLPEAVNDEKAHVTLPAGQQTLTGVQALGLARARKSLADGSDLRRIDRQQALVARAFKYMKDSGIFTDPRKMFDIAQLGAASLSVDSGLSDFNALAGLAWQMRNITPGHIHFVMVPYHADSEGGNAFLDDPITQDIFGSILADQIPASAKTKLTDPVSVPDPKSTTPTASASPTAKPAATPVCTDPLW